MKTMGYRNMLAVIFNVFALGVSAQGVLTVKVTNIPSAKGKVMVATDKGQYNMVDAKKGEAVLELKDVPEGKCKLYVYHDENGNYKLDRVDGVPSEYCAIVDLDVTVDTKTVNAELKDLQKIGKKSRNR